MKKAIKIKVQNGLSFEGFKEEVFDKNGLSQMFDFVKSENPDVIIFGPYGNDVPSKGNYLRIGYYCECITPDLSICDWAFGVPTAKEVNNNRYRRIQWHGLDPKSLIKNINVEEEFNKKTKFCNFLYSNHIPYREEFFRQLSKYKKVDAPGRSMNNMPSIDSQYTGSKWEIKRQFLTPYKFTIAFESYAYPGYQTEKLYDAMQMNSIPIYCGDPLISEVFNPKSLVDASSYVPVANQNIVDFLESNCQYNFKDYRPATYTKLYYKVRRKLKTIGKAQKMKLQLNKLDFSPLIDRIIELDRNPTAYMSMLAEPFLNQNKVEDEAGKMRWIEIFNAVN
ncbi:glycosyltransferase family 10 domain-containing protein [Pedobacter nototheniae]|uniref:glycosyltransferase family 10 domain-containing protein n=1 Tax=Pedobacter nototheniae TaxID=2488994 RepID=UPI00292CE477|nr:glycosyltransferase family 10 [Pedobacter nototheniae]